MNSLGVAECEYKWVQDGGGLCKEGWQLGRPGCDQTPLSEGCQHDDGGVRRPNAGPQHNVGDGHLGDANLLAVTTATLKKHSTTTCA